MSADLHDMHALLQQLRELNKSHDLDHCEGYWGDKFAAGAASVAAVGRGVAAAGKGAISAHKQHNLDAAAQKKRDAEVLAAWGGMGDPAKKQVLQDVIDQTMPGVIGPVLLGNEATKYIAQHCILPFPVAQK
jgi:hypothetical protein